MNDINFDDNFLLLFRTKDLSPPMIEVFVKAFDVVESGIEDITGLSTVKSGLQVIGAITTKMDEWKGRNELYYSLFGFCSNADFITNNPSEEEKKKGVWAVTDFYAGEETVKFLMKGLIQKPKIESIEDNNSKIKWERNIVSIGGPCNNSFSRWMMKLEQSPLKGFIHKNIPDLPFIFDYEYNKNIPIKNRNETTIYIPEIYDETDKEYKRVCKRDYAMIVKMKSLHEIGRKNGRWNLMIAGCHGGGTLGAAKSLGDEKFLKEIWNKVKTKDFQAIIAVETETEERIIEIEDGSKKKASIDLPKRVELIEVEPI